MYYNGVQRYEQFLQVGRLYRALILLGLTPCLPSASVFSLHGSVYVYFFLHPSLYLLLSWAWWDWPLTWLSGRTELECFEVVPKTGKWWTVTDILWERVPGGGSRNARRAVYSCGEDLQDMEHDQHLWYDATVEQEAGQLVFIMQNSRFYLYDT